jgi:hypothetical protein
MDGGEWSVSHPGLFTPRKRAPGTYWIGGWVGRRAVLDAVVKRKIPRLILNKLRLIIIPGPLSVVKYPRTVVYMIKLISS